jgi:hypothetical protein
MVFPPFYFCKSETEFPNFSSKLFLFLPPPAPPPTPGPSQEGRGGERKSLNKKKRRGSSIIRNTKEVF